MAYYALAWRRAVKTICCRLSVVLWLAFNWTGSVTHGQTHYLPGRRALWRFELSLFKGNPKFTNGVLRIHSRSSAESPFNRALTSSYPSSLVATAFLYRFWSVMSCWSRIANFSYGSILKFRVSTGHIQILHHFCFMPTRFRLIFCRNVWACDQMLLSEMYLSELYKV